MAADWRIGADWLLLMLIDAEFAESPTTLPRLLSWVRLQIATNSNEDEPIDVELYVNYPVVFDKRKRNKKNQELLKPYNVEGDWDENVYAIRIIVNIDSQADLSMMYDLIGELKDL